MNDNNDKEAMEELGLLINFLIELLSKLEQ